MARDSESRRRFIKGVGLAAGALGTGILPTPAAAQQGALAASSLSKAARFRAAMSDPQGFVLPCVNSVLMTRLCEMEGFKGGFIGGSAIAAQYGLPNNSLNTLTEVMEFMNQIIDNTDLPLLADAEDGGSPVITYRIVQGFEKAGAACVMIEDAVDPRTHFNGKGAPLVSPEEMVGRVKASVDARKDKNLVIMVRSDAPAKGRPEQYTLDVLGKCAEAGADAFFISGFTLDQQQIAKNTLKKPLMIGGGANTTPAEWKAKGVDMAFYHIENSGLGMIYQAIKELKTTGKFVEASKMNLPNEISAKLVNSAEWQARAKKYGMMM
jgi:2-methylisocitrate lyase-like PEP mutase family enzyme